LPSATVVPVWQLEHGKIGDGGAAQVSAAARAIERVASQVGVDATIEAVNVHRWDVPAAVLTLRGQACYMKNARECATPSPQ